MDALGSERSSVDERRRVLLAHDSTSSACAALVGALGQAFPEAELILVGSVEAARASLAHGRLDLALICLDLPPTPVGGVRVVRAALATPHPVVLVTRSLRWLPSEADDLRRLPWVTPEATAEDLARVIAPPSAVRPRHGAPTHLRLVSAAPVAVAARRELMRRAQR